MHIQARFLPRSEELKTHLQTAGRHIDNQNERLKKLENNVSSLKKDVMKIKYERDSTVEAKEKAQQEVHLGQVTYTMANIAEVYVYGENGSESFVHLDLSQLDDRAQSQTMTEEQLVRWNKFKATVSNKLDFQHILAVDKYLRYLRHAPAHDTTEQSRQTTASDLKAWASVHCSAKTMQTVQAYIDVLNLFSKNNRPLDVQQSDVRSILNSE